MNFLKLIQIGTLGIMCMSSQLEASELTIPNSFSAGTRAVAADVNANFTAVSGAVNDNDTRLAALEASIVILQASLVASNQRIDNLELQLTAVQSNNVLTLGDVVSIGQDVNGYQTVLFTGVNLQVINGTGNQNGRNGVGNMIIGYNEPASGINESCSFGEFIDQATCEADGSTWALVHKTGSHNLVGGVASNYSQTGGAVFGLFNTINGANASVLGGSQNIAGGDHSTISGGTRNMTTGAVSSVSGGSENLAQSFASSVNGGDKNVASGNYSSVSGGAVNTASGNFSTVSGGNLNFAMGVQSSISGGAFSRASGEKSSISGGSGNEAQSLNSSVSGGSGNVANGNYSSVSGGQGRSVTGEFNWAAGALIEVN